MNRVSAVSVTAAICTRDRPVQLRRALLSLAAQTEPLTEILVVDNAPATSQSWEIVRGEFPDVRYVREANPGLDFARNTALREATQPIVAFLDDDAVAGRDWHQRIRETFEESQRIAVCTGKVDALELDTDGQRLFEANGGFGRGDVRIRLPADASARRLRRLRAPLIAWSISVGSGASMAVRRDVLLGLGGFDVALDMGPTLPGGGDLDAIWRVLNSGYEVIYEPTAQALHEHRREVCDTIKQINEHNRSLIAVLVKVIGESQGLTRVVVGLFLIWRLIKPVVRVIRRLFGRDVLPIGALIGLTGATWRGLWAYQNAQRVVASCRLPCGSWGAPEGAAEGSLHLGESSCFLEPKVTRK